MSGEFFTPGMIRTLTESTGLRDEQHIGGVSAILLRTSPRKAEWQKELFSDLGIPIFVEASDWDEDSFHDFLAPGTRAAFKVSEHERSMNDQVGITEGGVLGLATDVTLEDETGYEIQKPIDVYTLQDIEERMRLFLLGSGNRRFYVNSPSALYYKDSDRNQDTRGLIIENRDEFVTRGLDEDEIELYIYGLNGRKGNSPSRLQNLLSQIVEENQVSGFELSRLERGYNLDELKQTNLGRWPNTILNRTIMSVNDVERSDFIFPDHLMVLQSSLVGAPIYIRHVIQDELFLENIFPESGDLYPQLPGTWSRMLTTRNARRIVVHRVTENDCLAISEMAEDNFRYADNYRDLDTEVREAFITTNDEQGVRETSSHPENIVSLVAKDMNSGVVAGYRVVRRGLHMFTQQPIAEGRRLHISREFSGEGLGTVLMRMSIEMVKEQGFGQMSVQASGNSRSFFEKMGFKCVAPGIENGNGVFLKTKQSPTIDYMVKNL